jgi:hypothetical protein
MPNHDRYASNYCHQTKPSRRALPITRRRQLLHHTAQLSAVGVPEHCLVCIALKNPIYTQREIAHKLKASLELLPYQF